MLVSWEDGSSRCKWLEESVSSPAGKFLVQLEEGAVCVEVAFRCCSAELQEGRSEAVGQGSLEHHLGRGRFVLFSRNRDMQASMRGEKCWGTGLKADPLCTPQNAARRRPLCPGLVDGHQVMHSYCTFIPERLEMPVASHAPAVPKGEQVCCERLSTRGCWAAQGRRALLGSQAAALGQAHPRA